MRKLFIIGIGAGNPDYITVQACKALSELLTIQDVFQFGQENSAREQIYPAVSSSI